MKVYVVFKKVSIDESIQLLRIYKNKEFAQKVVDLSNAGQLIQDNPFYIEEHEMIEGL